MTESETEPGSFKETSSETDAIEQEPENQRGRALRSAAISPGADRDYHLAHDPLKQPSVTIPTNAINDAFIIASDAVRFKRLGCAFLADFRAGKSTALEMIARELTDVLPEVACELVSAIEHDAVAERTFWGDLRVAFDLSMHGSAQDRKERLRAAIITACTEAGGRHFCLLMRG